MKIKVKDGKTLRFTAAADLSSGDLVAVGEEYNVIMINDHLTGDVNSVGETEGVFNVLKLAPEVIAQGDTLYVNGSGEVTGVDTGSLRKVGIAHVAAVSAATIVQLDIKPVSG